MVLISGYKSKGISNRENSRWPALNPDAGLRGHDLVRNPGLSNTTECGVGDFPLLDEHPFKSGPSSAVKISSVTEIRAQHAEGEFLSDKFGLKRELKKPLHRTRPDT